MLDRLRHLVALGAATFLIAMEPQPAWAYCGDGIVDGGEECDGGPMLYIDGDPYKGSCTSGSRCYYRFTCCKFNCQYVGTPGVPCQDGDSCSGPDVCNQVGVCLSGTAVTDGTPCDDGVFCNGTDTCVNGICATHTGDPCPGTACNECQEAIDSCFNPEGAAPCNTSACVTGGSCDGAGACVGGSFHDGPCDDGLFCNGADSCNGGACSAHAGDPCLESSDGDASCFESCDEDSDTCTAADPEGAVCDDGAFCDGAIDACVAGACLGAGSVACDDGNPCTEETCDEGLDSCATQGPVPDGTPCDDGAACTFGDVCTSGVCTGQPTVLADLCAWTVVLRENARGDQIRTGFRSSIDGDTCGGTYKLRHEAWIGSDLVCDEQFGTQIRLPPDARIGNDIVSTGAGAMSMPASGNLPYLYSAELGPGSVGPKIDASGIYDFSGNHPLAALCTDVRDEYDQFAGALDALVATDTAPGLTIPADTTSVLAVATVGGLNVIDVQGDLKLGKNALLEIDGGGDSATAVVLRVAGKLDLKLGASLLGIGGLTPDRLLVHVKGKQCKLGTLVLGAGTLYCASGRVKAKALTAWIGAVYGGGRKLQLGDYASVSYVPFTAF